MSFKLDKGDQHTPVRGLEIEDLLDIDVDLVRLCEHLVKSVLADDLPQCCLSDLVDWPPLTFSIAITDFVASTTR